MRSNLVRTVIIPLTVGVLTLSAGCAGLEEPGSASATTIESAALEVTPAPGPSQTLVQRFNTYVTYYSDATHTIVVGAASFFGCPASGDQSYRTGAQTEFHTIESEPCN